MPNDNVISIADYRRPAPVRYDAAPQPKHTSMGPQDVWQAIKLRQPTLLYEPRFDLNHGKVSGVDASPCLVTRENFVLTPSQLVRQVELVHLLIPFGRMLIERCCADLAYLRSRGARVDYLCLDLPMQLLNEDAGLYRHIHNNLEQHGLQPSDLMVGISEHQPAPVDPIAWRTLNALANTGTSLMLHTAGLSISSQHLLGRLPIHAMMLDRHLIGRLPQEESMRWVAQALLSVADKLNLTVVADGVGNIRQQRFLAQSGCSFGQGSALAPPMRLGELQSYLAAHVD